MPLLMTLVYLSMFAASVVLIVLVTSWVARKFAPLPWPAGAQAAIWFIWCDLYKQRWQDRPRVFFIRGKDLNCNGGKGWMSIGKCVAGQAMPWMRAINVAYPEGAKFHETALAHELWHSIPGNEEHTVAFQIQVANAVAALKGWEGA